MHPADRQIIEDLFRRPVPRFQPRWDEGKRWDMKSEKQ